MTGPAPAVAATRLAVRALPVPASPAARSLVAVSGGADSLALLAARRLRGAQAGRCGSWRVTVDHGLQPGSAAQAATVLAAGARPSASRPSASPSTVGGDGGPEAAARSARYAALARGRRRATGADAVLLGHTLDDQAETVLLGLARGSGARSLAGMREANGLLRRPLLGRAPRARPRRRARRSGLHAVARPDERRPATTPASGCALDALPALELALGPGVAEALVPYRGRSCAQDADALDAWAATALAQVTDETGGLDVGRCSALPAAVRARVLRAAARARPGSPGGSLAAAHVRELDRAGDRLARPGTGRATRAGQCRYGTVAGCSLT